MGTLSFLRRHSTLAVFTASLGASAFFVACGDDEGGSNEPVEAGTGGDQGAGGGGNGGSKGGGGGTAGKAGSAGTAGKGAGGAVGGAGGASAGGSAGSAGSANQRDAMSDVITSNGDAAADGDVPDNP